MSFHTVHLTSIASSITDDHLRFSRHIKTVDGGMLTPCRIWTGSEGFKMEDGRTFTPKRAAAELAGIDMPTYLRISLRCKIPDCVALSHMNLDF